VWCLYRLVNRLVDHASAIRAAVLLATSAAFIFYSSIPLAATVEVMMVLVAVDLLTQEKKSSEDLGALVAGLASGVNAACILPVVVLIAVVIRAKRLQGLWNTRRSYAIAGLVSAGLLSWLVL